MTNQQSADLALAQWQSLRALPPEDRIAELMATFFLPPSETDLEYELTMKRIQQEMSYA